jgi:hypothetical protein
MMQIYTFCGIQSHKDTKIKLKKEKPLSFCVLVYYILYTFAADFGVYTLLYREKAWIK